jgi:hypothetical protein
MLMILIAIVLTLTAVAVAYEFLKPIKRPAPPPIRRTPVPSGMYVDGAIPGPGDYELEVVGTSHYQQVLSKIVGGKTPDGHEFECDAVLVLEDSNPYDSNAVKVLINGLLCGHLSRENAKQYRHQLKRTGHPRITTSVKALIVGGWERGGGDSGHFGVRLDLPHE